MQKIFLIPVLAASLFSCGQNTYQPEVVDQTYIHRYGVEVTPKDWNARGGSGQVVSTLRNGIVVTRSYASNVLNGTTTYTFPHSELIRKTEEYSNGKLTKEIDHFASGEPKIEREYLPGNKTIISTWYENGNPQATETFVGEQLDTAVYYSADHKIEARVDHGFGERMNRDEYGNLLTHDAFEEGYLVTSTTYHANGTPKEVTPYVKNIVQGLKRSYLPDGEPNTIEEWYDGSQTGLTTLFQNGERIAEIPYVNGIKSGVERRFANGSRVVEEINWVNGSIHGPYNTLVGDKIQTDWYHRGKRDSKNTFETMENRSA